MLSIPESRDIYPWIQGYEFFKNLIFKVLYFGVFCAKKESLKNEKASKRNFSYF